jgi:hypothetical protein
MTETWLAYTSLILAAVLIVLLVVANVGGTRAHPPIPNRHQTADAIAMTSLIPRRSVRTLPIRPFTAVSDCPRCDTVAIHPMREAQPFDMGRRWGGDTLGPAEATAKVIVEAWGNGVIATKARDGYRVEPWGGEKVKIVAPLPELTAEDAEVDRDKLQAACANVVVRQCSCGQEWRES